MTSDFAACVAALRAELGAKAVSTDVQDLAHYGADRCRGPWPVNARVVIRPGTKQEVATAVQLCVQHDIAIVPSGGRTGLAGGATATAGEAVLSMERMNRVLQVDAVGKTLRCEAGVTVEAVQAAAQSAGLMYPIDFAAKGSAQIGGSIATNAGGVRVLRYGTTRAWVLGIGVVLPDGTILEAGGSLLKNNTGYDLCQLYVGSEGTLGVITDATLRLCSPPAATRVAACGLGSDLAVLDLFVRLGTSGLQLSAFECFDHACVEHVRAHRGIKGAFLERSNVYVLVEVEVSRPHPDEALRVEEGLTDCLAAAQAAGEIEDAVLAATPQQGRDLWAIREDISESLHRSTPHKADVSLPVAAVVNFLVEWRALVARSLPECEALVFGHVGDGNLHLNILRPPAIELESFLLRCHALDDEVYALVARHGGSISAEHGIGLLKREFLHYSRSDAALKTMAAIKRALDPRNLFNPGKILPG